MSGKVAGWNLDNLSRSYVTAGGQASLDQQLYTSNTKENYLQLMLASLNCIAMILLCIWDNYAFTMIAWYRWSVRNICSQLLLSESFSKESLGRLDKRRQGICKREQRNNRFEILLCITYRLLGKFLDVTCRPYMQSSNDVLFFIGSCAISLMSYFHKKYDYGLFKALDSYPMVSSFQCKKLVGTITSTYIRIRNIFL